MDRDTAANNGRVKENDYFRGSLLGHADHRKRVLEVLQQPDSRHDHLALDCAIHFLGRSCKEVG